jgi:hypothetical protein
MTETTTIETYVEQKLALCSRLPPKAREIAIKTSRAVYDEFKADGDEQGAMELALGVIDEYFAEFITPPSVPSSNE